MAKWNSIPGDVSSSNRLLMNIIQTDNSDLKLDLSDMYFDASMQPHCEYNNDLSKVVDDDDGWMDIQLPELRGCILRPKLSGYKITNNTSDDEDSDG